MRLSSSISPVLAVALVLGAGVSGLLAAMLAQTGGLLIYPLDDTYIHMSIARTLAESGVWGLDRTQPAAASSSPLWVVLLAALGSIPALADAAPLLINVIAGLATLWIADGWLAEGGTGWPARILALASIVVLAPLPSLIVLGMEHTAFVASALVWICSVWRPSGEESARARWVSAAAACALAALRPEGMLLILAGPLAHSSNRRARQSLAIGAAVSVALAAVWWFHDGVPAPFSTLLKSELVVERSRGLIANLARLLRQRALTAPAVPALCVAVLIVTVARSRVAAFNPLGRFIVALTILHLLLAEVGSQGRYEAYIIVVGVLVLVASLAEGPRPRTNATLALVVLLAAWPLAARAASVVAEARWRSTELYRGPFQAARFLASHPAYAPFVATGVGVLSYFPRQPIVDHAGLGSPAIAKARLEGRFSTAVLDREAQRVGARTAFYEDTSLDIEGPLPETWRKVARWAKDGVSDYSYVIGVYALAPTDGDVLARDLRAFAATMPAGAGIDLIVK